VRYNRGFPADTGLLRPIFEPMFELSGIPMELWAAASAAIVKAVASYTYVCYCSCFLSLAFDAALDDTQKINPEITVAESPRNGDCILE
jgi:hypothetical protein